MPRRMHDAGTRSAPSLQVVEIALTEIAKSDDTFRQRAILDVDDLVAELRVAPQEMPVFLRRRPDRRYQIIAGFRRIHALSELGRPTAKAVVVAVDDAAAWRIAWAENVGRQRLRTTDWSYLVFKLHDEGRNAEEIAELLGMSERDASRVRAVGRLPERVRDLVRAHGMTLRHAAVLAPFLRVHPRLDVEPTLAAAAKAGYGEAKLATALASLATKKRGRKPTGVRFASPERLTLDIARADPTNWSEAMRRQLRTIRDWLDVALASDAPVANKRASSGPREGAKRGRPAASKDTQSQAASLPGPKRPHARPLRTKSAKGRNR